MRHGVPDNNYAFYEAQDRLKGLYWSGGKGLAETEAVPVPVPGSSGVGREGSGEKEDGRR